MRFTALQADLKEAFDVLVGIIAKKSTIPALGYVSVEALADHVILSATDLDLAMKTKIKARCEVPGKTLVAGEKAQMLIAALAGGDIAFELNKAGTHMSLKQFAADYKLPTLAANQAPPWPELSQAECIGELPAKDFQQALNTVSFAVPKQAGRYVMNGILVDKGRFVSTDGFRLMMWWADWAEDIKDLLIPKRAADVLLKLFAKEGKLSVVHNGQSILFTYGDWSLYSRKLQGKFPPYESAVPSEDALTLRATFEAAPFAEKIRRVTICSDSERKIVHFKFISGDVDGNGGKVELYAKAPDQSEAFDVMPLKSCHGDLEVCFDGHGFSELFDFTIGEVEFCGSTPEGGALIECGTEFKCVIAPMKAQV